MKGKFSSRRDAVNEAKSNLFADWFTLIGYADGSWDYVQPGRNVHAVDERRDSEYGYLRSRKTDRWYISWRARA